MHLTESIIQGLTGTGKQRDIYDDEQKGLIIRVNGSGSKTYTVQYDRGKRMKIADFGEISLKAARLKAMSIIADYKKGRLEKKRTSDNVTYSRYLVEVDYPWLLANTRSGKDTYQMLKAFFVPLFGNRNLHEITKKEIEDWKKSRLALGISKSTIDRNLGAFKASLNRAVQNKLIDTNPAAGVKLFGEYNERIRYLSDEERGKLLDKLKLFPKHFQTIVILALYTGLRRKEILTLEKENIFLNAEYPYILIKAANYKTNRMHSVTLNSIAKTALLEWLETNNNPNSKYVFVNPQTNQPYAEVRRSWDRLCKLAGLNNFRFHDQRHDCASRLVQKGVDLYTVSRVLGHTTTKMTQKYAHIAAKTLAEAVARLD